jgi:DNA-binding beta-propeller fold protein YncE/4-amino-4-deoxy-L-arabinose transferase-like glycosyltransferase
VRAATSRRLLLALDVLFGVVLLGVALVPSLPSTLNQPRQAQVVQPAPRLVSRLGGIAPPGQPSGFAVAPDGTLGIVDRSRGVVMHLDASGQPLAEWGPLFGSGLDAQDLLGLAAEPGGWYVLDRGALRVLHLDTSGKVEPERTIDLKPLAPYGPNGLGVDARGNLYLADTGRDRVLAFDRTGRLASTIGDSGQELGKLKQPMGVASAPDGSLFVADWENGRVERWNARLEAASAWQLPRPAQGLAVDPAGRVYVPDHDQRLVRAYDADGQLLFQFGGGDNSPPLPIDAPLQVGVSPDGATLWVLGTTGLGSIDLRPFADVRPSEAAVPVRWPLAVAGLALLGVAAAAGVVPGARALRPQPKWPTVRAPKPAMGVAAPSYAKPRESGPKRLLRTAGLFGLPARESLLAGGVLFVAGLGAAIVAELRVLDPLAQNDPWPRLALLVLACVACAVGVAVTAQVLPLALIGDWPGIPDKEKTPTKRTLAWLGPAVLLAVAAGAVWWLQRFHTPEATRAAFMWLLALAVAAGVVARACDWRVPRISLLTLVPWLLFALALAPRIWNQADLPYGIWFDEAESALQARRFLQEGRFTPIADTFGRDASLFYYLVAVAMQFVSDPLLAVRGTAAVSGALNAPLVYLLGRELWGWRVGLLAGVLLALSRWHLDISRLGMTTILAPVFATLAFWLLARALRRGRWMDAAWAGMAFGLGMHGYLGFRALPAVALVLLVYGALRYRWPASRTAVYYALFAGGLVIVALPLLIFAAQDPTSFNGRLSQTLIFTENATQAQKLGDLWSNVQKHALMFHVRGDMNGRHNLPGWPMLDPFSGLVALLGLAWLIIHFFEWRAWLVFGWGAVAMSGGIFTLPFEAPQAIRTFAVTPLIALLAALGLLLIADRLAVRASAWAMTGLAGVIALGIGLLNVNTFFARQMQDPAVWESFSTRETIPVRTAPQGGYEAILASQTLAPSVQAGLLPPPVRDTIRAFDASTDLPYRGAGPALIVLETEHDAALVDQVMRMYPTARRVPILAPGAARPLVEEVILDRDVLAARRGMAAVGDGAWRALLAVDPPGMYRLAAPAGLQLSVDGSAPANQAQFDLWRGNHVLDVRGTLPPGQTLEVLWQPPNATELRVIDPRALLPPPEGGTGLAATLYPTQTWQGSPQVQLIDPLPAHYFHTNPFSRVNFDPHNSWSAEWVGLLDVAADGTYRFEADRQSRAGLWIDDRQVFDDTADGAPEMTAGTIELQPGEHYIRVRFQDRGQGGPHLYLYWTPPGGARQVVPGRVLRPPEPPPLPLGEGQGEGEARS